MRIARTAVAFLLGLSPAALADDHATAAVAGAGGSSVAHPSDNGVIRTNPGAVGLSERYDIHGLFRYGPSPGLYWSVSAVDAKTNDFVTFGLAYDGAITAPPFLPDELPGFAVTGVDPSNRKEKHDITFALAAPFLDRKISVGLNGTLVIFNNAWNGKGTTGNMDFGIAAAPVKYLTIGLSGRDVIPVADQFDRPATLAFGLRSGVPDLIMASVEADHRFEHATRSPWDVRAGLEGTIKFVKVRGGYNWAGDEDIHRVTFGLGASSKSGSIDYAFQVPVNDPDLVFVDVIHTISVTVKIKGLRRSEDTGDDSPIKWNDN